MGNDDVAAAADLTAIGEATVFRGLAVVRGVDCDNELDDDDDDDVKSPYFGAGLGAIMTAGV
jgi:hypothetical protein